ncbi:lipopolysaccharide biosynthesis protein [Mucilaginibacter glaciei]|uniref:Oligosaccharide flippase family protein n=1 Tax=Mucilaginibacter glaciei TaxID=2772109 RepID=A0A926P0I1_9SPHI|nr:oligosaccharide flippase family protein [Mucilaginibacter glaciei]MBD1395398.1 oligosaccharide flippase family protein [Mucilaginibacter glaciei]
MMLQTIQNTVTDFFTRGHQRTLTAKKNIIKSVFLKGGSVAISLVLLPLTINYVNPAQFGIWLTLSSIMVWAAFFDLGLGSGLRNKLATALATNNYELARIYVSTTYAVLLIVLSVFFLLFYLINPYINWTSVLNSGATTGLNNLVLLMVGLFFLQFIIQLMHTVLGADQKTADSTLINVAGQALVLLVIFILTKTIPGSLNILLIAMAGIPLVVLTVASIWLYRGRYKMIAPSFGFIKMKHAGELLGTGSIFLMIQFGIIIVYETDNIVITQLFGPADVTTFNMAYKLFSVMLMLLTLVVAPLWSAFTEAFAKQEHAWIKSTLQKITQIFGAFSLLTLLLLALSPVLYRLWLGKDHFVPFSLSVLMCFYIIACMWQATNVYLMNGLGKIRLQLYVIIASAVLNVPLSIWLGKQIGLQGIVLSNLLICTVMGLVFQIQANKIVNGTATGIFNK